MKFFYFILLLLFQVTLNAEFVDHLKKVEAKGTNHAMKNIDFIYLINLDKRPEKFTLCCQQLSPYNIHPFRFSAVNGWELTLEAINEVGLKYAPGMTSIFASSYPIEAEGQISHEMMRDYGKTYFAHGFARGTIGCALSHISVLKDAWDSGYETIWVMEDDIEVIRDPRMLSELIERLDALLNKQWDVLLTDQDYRSGINQYIPAQGMSKRPDMDCTIEARFSNAYTMKKDISEDFRKITARFGAHSMIIRRSGIKKLLDFHFAHKIFLPYDIENYLPPDLQRYCVRYDVVSNMLNAITDNGRPNYLKK